MGLNGISSNAAASAYQNTQGIKGIGSQVISAPKTEGTEGASFADLLKNNIQGAVDTMRGGEQMAAKAVTGEADLTDVVQSITAAELTLQTVVSVRDRMISAYQEILRMPI